VAEPHRASTRRSQRALHYLNLDWEADEFIQFIADLEPNDDGAMQIMYGIDGRGASERRVHALSVGRGVVVATKFPLRVFTRARSCPRW
jgi:hypothetical protein